MDDGRHRGAVSGGEMAFLEVGHPKAPPVVLLHGFPTSSFLWRSFVPALATEMRVIAPDLLGAGDSDKPAGVALDTEAQAGYVRELLGVLGVSRYAVVGHGDGGAVAQLLAIEDPVAAVVLIDSAGAGASPAAAIERVLGAAAGGPAAYIAQALRKASTPPGRISDDVAAAYARPFDGPDGPDTLARWAAAAGTYPSGLDERLPEVDVPTFLLWGEDDPFVPTVVADRLNEVIAASSLALLPGCGHFLPEEAAPTIVPLVAQWLGGRYLGRIHGHAHGPVLVQLDPRRSEADG